MPYKFNYTFICVARRKKKKMLKNTDLDSKEKKTRELLKAGKKTLTSYQQTKVLLMYLI